MSLDHIDDLYPPRRKLDPRQEIVSLTIRKQSMLPLSDALAALVADALAQRSGGSFILHLDDTDPEPLCEGNPEQISNMLSWLDISPTEFGEFGPYGPYSWTQRRHMAYKDWPLDIYREVVNHLIDEGWAYPCFCQAEPGLNSPLFFKRTPGYKQQCRDLSPEEVENRLCIGEPCLVRFRVPLCRSITYHDAVFGIQTFETESIEDFALLTPDGMPMPWLAHVVDNHFMRVSTQLRRNCALTTLFEEILLNQALGWEMPRLVHLPAIHDPAMNNLFEETSLDSFQQRGYLPETMRNYLTQLIWSHPQGKLIYPHRDFQQHFDVETIPSETLTIDYALLDDIEEGYTMK